MSGLVVMTQRKIFTMAQDCLPKLGYAKRAHLMNPMVPGLAGGKMSSSDPNSKIDFLDSAADVKKKIKAAFCEEKNITDNGILSFHKAVLFPLQTMRIAQLVERGENPASAENRTKLFISPNAPEGTLVTISRDEKFGGDVHYQQFQQMEDEFASGALHPGDLKKITTEMINDLLEPVRKVFKEDQAFQDAERAAYPPPPAPVKVVKKSKVSLDGGSCLVLERADSISVSITMLSSKKRRPRRPRTSRLRGPMPRSLSHSRRMRSPRPTLASLMLRMLSCRTRHEGRDDILYAIWHIALLPTTNVGIVTVRELFTK